MFQVVGSGGAGLEDVSATAPMLLTLHAEDDPALVAEPAVATLTVTPKTLDGADPETLVLVRWNPEGWVEVPSTFEVAADGTVTIVAEVTYPEAAFVVLSAPSWGTFDQAPASGLTLTMWRGGGYDRLSAALE